ncbi:MAG: DUF6208 family protein [Cyanophyceae cyanobacterium]
MIHWWEIPLALLSFLFNKVVKFFIGVVYTLYLAFNQQRAHQWQVLSEETLKKPLSLPVLMTKAPRWNTHAIIGTLGPFRVQTTISLDGETANQSAQSWIAIFYSFPGYQTIASLESKHVAQDGWVSVNLRPGQYTIGLRYYSWYQSVRLPAIKADGQTVAAACEIDPQINQFYHSLSDKKNWFYLGLHTYIFTLLKANWLPAPLVKREYLPVGATDTKFFYGYLHKNDTLQVNVYPQLLSSYDIYLTLYDRSSLPVSWCQLESEQTAQAIHTDGSYLFRLRQKPTVLETAIPLNQAVDRQPSQVTVMLEPAVAYSC